MTRVTTNPQVKTELAYLAVNIASGATGFVRVPFSSEPSAIDSAEAVRKALGALPPGWALSSATPVDLSKAWV